MSKVSIQGDISGTGDFTIKAPNSNVDRTLNLPDEAGTLATVENLPAGYTDSDALDLFNATGTAPVYACRAWVNFDGTGTVSIRESGNVSSITDNGTGDYNVNFTTAMPDGDYAIAATGGRNSSGIANFYINTLINVPTTSSFRLQHQNTDSASRDATYGMVSVFR